MIWQWLNWREGMEIKGNSVKTWSRLGARAVYGLAVLELAKERDDFLVATADLAASSGLARFMTEFPDRFVNVGIAEQNLIGVAAGLAKDGTPVFATSFAPFITMRACEQVRMNMGYMQLNVKTVGLGAGLIMGFLGNSHYGIEDVSVMRCIPGITIVSPADGLEIYKAVEAVAAYPGPVYLRLTGGPGLPIVYDADYTFEIGKANILRNGQDVAIAAAGTMVCSALKTAEILAAEGIECTVADMHTIKPLDRECVDSMLGCKLIVTLEEHTVIGGLGSAVLEYIGDKKKSPPVLRLGIEDFWPHAGDYEYLLDQCGLTPEKISGRILEQLRKGED